MSEVNEAAAEAQTGSQANKSVMGRMRFTVKHKLALILLVLFIGIVSVGMAYRDVLEVTNNARALDQETFELTEVIGNIEREVLQARRQEKNFLLRDDLRYLDRHARAVDAVQQQVSTLARLLDVEKELAQASSPSDSSAGDIDDFIVESVNSTVAETTEQGQIVSSLRRIVENYEQLFASLADGRKRIGLSGQDGGLRRRLEFSLASLDEYLSSSANANRDLLLALLQLRKLHTEYLAEPTDAAYRKIEQQYGEFRTELDRIALADDAARGVEGALAEYQNLWPQVVSLSRGIESTTVAFQEAVIQIDPLLKRLGIFANEIRADNQAKTEQSRRSISARFFATLIIAGVIIFVSLIVLSRNLTSRLSLAVRAAKQIARGDLSEEIMASRSTDEVGELMTAMSTMQSSLQDIIGKTREAAHQVTVGSQHVMTGNTELSSRTQEQASSLEEIAASMEEMTGTVSQNAESANQANELAKAAQDKAAEGSDSVTKTIEAMQAISDSNSRISDILEVIQDIAFQTNLLALNAAVEAARAGEHGRGFAVVAAEVRSLATRSSSAAKDIKGLIENGLRNVTTGLKVADSSGVALAEIVESVKRVNDVFNEIAAASIEQSDGITQVNKALVQMEGMTQQNAALVEEAAAASQSLGDQAVELIELVAFFQLDSASAMIRRNEDSDEIWEEPEEDAAILDALPDLPDGPAPVPAPEDEDDEWTKF